MSFVITFALFGPPFPFDGNNRMLHERFGPPPQFGHYFSIARFVLFLVSLVWLGVGIRQWFMLSNWTRRYERYRELQRKIDQKLDYNDDRSDKDRGVQATMTWRTLQLTTIVIIPHGLNRCYEFGNT